MASVIKTEKVAGDFCAERFRLLAGLGECKDKGGAWMLKAESPAGARFMGVIIPTGRKSDCKQAPAGSIDFINFTEFINYFVPIK